MAAVKLSLNIYGENDEILKTYETEHIRWRMFTEAVKIDDEMKDASTAEQMDAVGNFVLSLFVGMTRDELELADITDVFNVFNMVVKLANKINPSKNV